MSLLKIARMGNPILRQKAISITKEKLHDPSFLKLIEDMKETLTDSGGIGLAAPQVHESLQLAIIHIPKSSDRYPYEVKPFPLTIFINPVIKVLDSNKKSFYEGCLSIPGLRGEVARPQKIEITYQNLQGEEQKLMAQDFLATVIQHELDHLEGILYIDRMEDLTKLSFVDEYEKFLL